MPQLSTILMIGSAIGLTDYSLLPNKPVFVQNTYSSFLCSKTEYNLVITFKVNKKQFCVRGNLHLY